MPLSIVKLFNELTELGIENGPALFPPKIIFEVESVVIVPAVIVIGLPFNVNVFPLAINAPEVNVSVPFIVLLVSIVTPPELLTVRLFIFEIFVGDSTPIATADVPV